MTRPGLEDERSFLLRSLEDLDREHDAGDLSDEDHAALRDEYIARAAAVLRSPDTDASAAAPAPAPGPRRAGRRGVAGLGRLSRRRLVVPAVVAVVVGVAVWALVAQLSSRLPGETVTGSITLSASQQTARTLAQAQTLENEGDAADAVKLYETVLRRQPDQEEALAEVGWLEYEAGAQAKQPTLLALGQQQEQKAERVAPGAFAPHLYLGSMFLAEGRPLPAVTEYRLFLADHPPRATVSAAVPFITRAFSAAHQPVPPLPPGTSSTG
ncbi:MAG TPA: hypothetical protein VID75_00900 [Acidimicrobiales bacterium]|jgi:tetratricopeptide (TPR) repeat protein